MAEVEPGKIRNVAVVGHRGTGKTSLVEAMLFQAGATNRLGTVEQGTTISDWDEDEQQREMSISASLCHLEWQGRKINLIDTLGEPSFQGDAIAGLHVVEGALITVSGVMGVEVQTGRNWARADELGLACYLETFSEPNVGYAVVQRCATSLISPGARRRWVSLQLVASIPSNSPRGPVSGARMVSRPGKELRSRRCASISAVSAASIIGPGPQMNHSSTAPASPRRAMAA